MVAYRYLLYFVSCEFSMRRAESGVISQEGGSDPNVLDEVLLLSLSMPAPLPHPPPLPLTHPKHKIKHSKKFNLKTPSQMLLLKIHATSVLSMLEKASTWVI